MYIVHTCISICLLFIQKVTAISNQPRGRSGFLNMIGVGSEFWNRKEQQNVEVTKIKCLDTADNCNISLTSAGE